MFVVSYEGIHYNSFGVYIFHNILQNDLLDAWFHRSLTSCKKVRFSMKFISFGTNQRIWSIYIHFQFSYWKKLHFGSYYSLVTKIVVKKIFLIITILIVSSLPWTIEDVRPNPPPPTLCQHSLLSAGLPGGVKRHQRFPLCWMMFLFLSNMFPLMLPPSLPPSQLLIKDSNELEQEGGHTHQICVWHCSSRQTLQLSNE